MITATKPKLIVIEAPSDKWREKWNALTQEDRKKMSAAALIKAMGPLHATHKDYQPRPFSLLPMPNLAGVQPCISRHDCGIFAQWRQIVAWATQ